MKQLFLKNIIIVVLFGVFIASPAYAQTVVEVAQSDDQFTSLVDAVVAQDLVETLSDEGPFTVFAPTNDAFLNLPSYAVRVLEENPDALTDVLLYHVVPGELRASDVLSETALETALGESASVNATAVTIGGANIIATDIEASNGVVHVIDSVILPPSAQEVALQLVLTDLRDALRLYVELLTDLRATH